MRSMTTNTLRRWTRGGDRTVVAVFIAAYALAWAYLVGFTDPARWEPLLALGFSVLFALVLIHEIVATAESLRAHGPQAPLPASVGAERQAVATTRVDCGANEFKRLDGERALDTTPSVRRIHE